ncbi:hypothetical protein DSM112329_02085 [Paraconexibacter sp. AEG42_29]|uniref:Uncharacterized protein n=1 Tax=Paraconexibacter sp. AEG42_29 TaxID=2997339 RepID=A0AAU7AUF4_9ACTN
MHKGTGQRYHSTLRRGDGVLVRLEGGSYNTVGGPVPRVPHDIAHLVVERGLGVDRGLWGVLAAGGLVQNASFVQGRLPPHAKRQAGAVSDAAGEQLRQAEVLVRLCADVAAAGVPRDLTALRRTVGERWWSPALTPDALGDVRRELHTAARAWDELAPGEALELAWRGTT